MPATLLSLCSILVLSIPAAATAQAVPPVPAVNTVFVENAGQEDAAVRFTARNGKLTSFFTEDAFVFSLQRDAAGEPGGEPSDVRVALCFEGASESTRVSGEGPVLGRFHYYRGSDSSQWVEGVPTYGSVRYEGLHPGVDVLVLERDRRIAYDLHLAPGADLSRFVVRCEGVERLELTAGDELVLHTTLGPLVLSLPAAWEVDEVGGQVPVSARFRLLGEQRFGFEVDGWQSDRALVIDPGVTYGSYLGGALLDRASGVAVAADGGLLLAGVTGSPNFPATPGAYQENRSGQNDAFLARIDPLTGQIDFATFFGGTDDSLFNPEGAKALELGADGSIYLGGRAQSVNFPTTPGVFRPAGPTGVEGFVAKFDATGVLIWSTLIGGAGDDEVVALAVASNGQVTVAGNTASPDFPATPGAFDESFNSIFFTGDMFVARLSADATSLDYATYLGGSLVDVMRGLALDANGAAVVVGLTGSSDFPATSGAYDDTFNGAIPNDSDGFVARVSPAGDALEWATFLGGVSVAEASDVCLDGAGRPVVVGRTETSDFPVIGGAFQDSYRGGLSDGFVSMLSADGSKLIWSTYLGGSDEDEAWAVTMGLGGLPTVVGSTRSMDFPTRSASPAGVVPGGGTSQGQAQQLSGGGTFAGSGAGVVPGSGVQALPSHDAFLGGAQDAFVARLDAKGTRMLYGTLHGGDGVEVAYDVVLDPFGAAVFVGETDSLNMPLSADAADSTGNGVLDAFVTRIAVPPFESLLQWLPGADGKAPRLRAEGDLEPGGWLRLILDGARPDARVYVLASRSASAVPFQGGTLAAFPVEDVLFGMTSAQGKLELFVDLGSQSWPSGATLVLHAWVVDPEGPRGLAASNGLSIVVP